MKIREIGALTLLALSSDMWGFLAVSLKGVFRDAVKPTMKKIGKGKCVQ